MQRKIFAVLSFGFLIGLGLASCASQQNSRTVSSDQKEKIVTCLAGEEKNENGECVRIHTFDRPFRRGGR